MTDLERAHAEHRMLIDFGIDAQVIRNLVFEWSTDLDERIINYLLAATS